MKKLLSYLFPFTRRVPSAVSGELEVTLYQGRKVLDSRTANYSYGALQRVLRFGLQQIPLEAVRHVLLLGLGGGSVIQTLRQELHYRHPITAVELDPAVIQLAAEEFGITAGPELRIVQADAFAWVQQAPERFGLIIVDISIDSQIPPEVFGLPFWQALHRLLEPGGSVLLNAIEAPGHAALTATLHQHAAQLGLELRVFQRVEKLNQLVVARKP
ncbi:fused MFS/spermidine synthase [Hymenobacter sp. J193]|uniref:spermidine synthase n=1 Tax=Hymenobacter sp. J193 TaxID=2898429 RepID=UPI0021517311|nr:fused MFS/spermidine synthase [Hymenobacter sp. J193]MCR5887597.1 fused MFS/spermidine synthase [Hymenobacter sp. J193]